MISRLLSFSANGCYLPFKRALVLIKMKILIIYDSRLGAVEKMARLIARGVASQGDCEAVVRRVPDLGDTNLSDSGDPFASLEDLTECDGPDFGKPYPLWQYVTQTQGFCG